MSSTLKNKLNLRIITLAGVKYDKMIRAIQINLKDGLMIINKNYSSVIEELKEGEIKIFLHDDKTFDSFFVGDGLMVVNNNNCEIFSSDFKKI